MIISSRTPEGQPNSCPICAALVRVDPSIPPGEAPCPKCGHLLWFDQLPVTVVRFNPVTELDTAELQKIATETPAPRILLNLEGVNGLSSRLTGEMVKLKHATQKRNGKLVLCSIDSSILRDMFQANQLDKVFEIRSDESEGLAAFS